jgi:hypothetical protein
MMGESPDVASKPGKRKRDQPHPMARAANANHLIGEASSRNRPTFVFADG